MPTCTTASSRTWWSNTNDLKCPPRCSGKTSCGTQRPFRALSGTHVLLAAAPTTPSCFCRRQRSSLLQRKHYFGFCKSGRAAAPPDLLFHGWGRSGKLHRLLLAYGQIAADKSVFCTTGRWFFLLFGGSMVQWTQKRTQEVCLWEPFLTRNWKLRSGCC